MAYNPYSPYPSNPYGQPMYGFNQPNYNQPQAPQYPQNENVYAFVNGVEGAKSYQLRPNQSVMLMDSEQPLCYMKSANAMGQATLRYFRLTEISENDAKGASAPAPTPDYVAKADFNALSRRVDELTRQFRKSQPKAEPQKEGE